MDRDLTADTPEHSTLSFEIRPTCFICHRLSVTFDARERPMCARHATIFMVDHAELRARKDGVPPS